MPGAERRGLDGIALVRYQVEAAAGGRLDDRRHASSARGCQPKRGLDRPAQRVLDRRRAELGSQSVQHQVERLSSAFAGFEGERFKQVLRHFEAAVEREREEMFESKQLFVADDSLHFLAKRIAVGFCAMVKNKASFAVANEIVEAIKV